MNLLTFTQRVGLFPFITPTLGPTVKISYSIVASLNAKWKDWGKLSEIEYANAKKRLCDESLDALEKNPSWNQRSN